MGLNIAGYVKNENKGYWDLAPINTFGIIERYIDEDFGIRFCQPLRAIVLKAGPQFDFRSSGSLSLDREKQVKLMVEVEKQYAELPKGNETKKWCNLLLKFLKVCVDNDYRVIIA